MIEAQEVVVPGGLDLSHEMQDVFRCQSTELGLRKDGSDLHAPSRLGDQPEIAFGPQESKGPLLDEPRSRLAAQVVVVASRDAQRRTIGMVPEDEQGV